MNPNDGFGCGRSLHWENQAVKVAIKLGENCEHLDIKTILIKMLPQEKNSDYLVKCKVTCIMCDASYDKTTKKLTEKFLKFYGRK